MKKTWVRDLKPGVPVEDVFVLRYKELKEFEKGNMLKLELGDKTGRIDAVVWDNADTAYGQAEVGDFVRVRGFTSTFRNATQIRVENFSKIEPQKVEVTDFLPRSKTSPEELLENYRNEAGQIGNPYLKRLLEIILADSPIVEKLKLAPGGKLWHHNYVGGLLEHTLKIVEICKKGAELYELVDRDLLIAGALLHDIGKIYQYQVTSFLDYSDEGRLIGHIVEGDRIVTEKIKLVPDFPEELSMRLRHLILSHQGKLEMGSPVVPLTLEGIILHNADEMDANAGAFTRIIESEKGSGKKWSSYVSLINRYIYLGEKKPEKE